MRGGEGREGRGGEGRGGRGGEGQISKQKRKKTRKDEYRKHLIRLNQPSDLNLTDAAV